jgi:ELWxxDGT repeat protein
LYFYVSGGGFLDLWKSNGTVQGTAFVKRLGSTNPAGYSRPVPFGSLALFPADTPENGARVWRTDGTDAGTFPVSPSTGSLQSRLTEYNGAVYFQMVDPTSGRSLWRTDGSLGGTHLVRDGFSTTQLLADFVVHDGLLFFSATDAQHGRELAQVQERCW